MFSSSNKKNIDNFWWKKSALSIAMLIRIIVGSFFMYEAKNRENVPSDRRAQQRPKSAYGLQFHQRLCWVPTEILDH